MNLIKRAIRNEAKLLEIIRRIIHPPCWSREMFTLIFDPTISIKIVELISRDETLKHNRIKKKKEGRELLWKNFRRFSCKRKRMFQVSLFRDFSRKWNVSSRRSWSEIFKLPFKNSILGPGKKLRLKAWTMLWHMHFRYRLIVISKIGHLDETFNPDRNNGIWIWN